MTPTITINGLTVVHRESDGVATSGAPDVCRSPDIPVPYVNVAYSRDLQNGTTTVFTDGVMAAIRDCYFLPSYGDEPGTGGGIISNVNMKKARFSNYSMDVFMEGRNVCRLTDPMTMNGNAPNTFSPTELQENIGGNTDILCQIFCWCDEGNKGSDFIQLEDNLKA
ncbi:DUF4150 domain-containing protein [Consotaella aegiceratis]|uniref:DUF4150 domain-containing protein n=1 Tax=Consotaella aegiceratis TaxID=3097961 RepID=UPI002F4289D6